MSAPESTPAHEPHELRPRPWALVWLFVWLVVLEFAARLLWTPARIGHELYAKHEPTFSYGFEFARPPCEPSDDDTFTCYPTQYRKTPLQHFDAHKRDDTVRMFTLGGSHAAGEVSYTSELGKLLAKRCPAVHWEPLNFAVVGQGSRRARLAAEQAERYEPDVIILDFGGSNEFEDERDWSYREQLHEGIWRYLLESRAIVIGRKLLSQRFDFTKPEPVSGEDETAASKKPENLERWREGLATNFRALIANARAQGLEVIVVGRASLKPHAKGSREAADYELFSSLAAEGVHLLDAHALFQAVDDKTRAELFRRDKNHYSRPGQQRVAKALAKLVLEELDAARPCRADR